MRTCKNPTLTEHRHLLRRVVEVGTQTECLPKLILLMLLQQHSYKIKFVRHSLAHIDIEFNIVSLNEIYLKCKYEIQ